MKTVLDWSKFNESGLICLSTDTLSVISALIRGLEVATVTDPIKGVGAVADYRVPSHCFITYIKNDLIKGIEMTWPKDEEDNIIPTGGVNVFDLGSMSSNALLNHIVMLARPPFLDSQIDSDAALNWIKDKEKHDKDKYGILNLFAYMGIGSNQPHQEVCAQFTKTYLADMENFSPTFLMPDRWFKENKVSPYDQMLWFKENGWDIPFTKQVEDNYYPNQEIISPEEN
jgi:hypothetical protein